jgi:hypothetical protein
MANSDAAATLRSDINTLVEEAARTDQMFIGLRVFPEWSVNEKSSHWPKFRLAKGELLNNDATKRTPGGGYGQVFRTYENDNFVCEDYGLEELIDDTYRADVARFFSAEVVAANQVRRQVMIGHEQRVATALIDTNAFTATAASVDYTEALIATINFVKDISDASSRLNDKGVIPNTIVMSKNVFNRVRRSTLFANYLRGIMGNNADKLPSAANIASVFADEGITQCLVGKMPRNNAKKGQAYSATAIWPDTHIWVGYVSGGNPMAGGAGRTVVWNKEGGLFVSETYRDEARRSDIVRVRHSVDEKVVDGTSGELITTNYA